eukprot:scaffold907_cov167-Alexandrium_tamarense.AAC.2
MEACTAAAMQVGKRENIDEKPSFRGSATAFEAKCDDNTNTPVDASNVTSTADDASGDVSPWTEGTSAVKNEDVQSMSPTRTSTTDASTQSQPDVQKPLDASKEESSNPTDDATDNIIEETKGNGKDSVIVGDTPPTVKAGESHPADEDENDVSKVVVTKDKEGNSQESGSNEAEPMNKVNVGVGTEDDADEAPTTTTAEGALEFNPATIPSQDVTKGREDVKDTYMDVDAMENAGKTLRGAVVGGATAASAAAGEKLEERVKMNLENTGHLTNTEDKAAATAVKVNIPVQGEGGSIAVVHTGEAKGGVKMETGLSKVEEKESDTEINANTDIVDIEDEEDPLAIYSENQEPQDTSFAEVDSTKVKNELQTRMNKLKEEKKQDLNMIKTYLKAKWDERNTEVQSQADKLRGEMLTKQQRQRTQLSEKHKRQLEADGRKIEEGMKWLVQRQQLELEQKMQQHKHAAQQMGVTQESMAEWNQMSIQLQTRHSQQLQQFESKKIDLNRKSEQELSAQNAILEAHHKKRQHETNQIIDELVNKCHRQQDYLKAKLVRQHKERFETKRNALQSQLTESAKVDTYRGPDHELHPNQRSGSHDAANVSHNAVTRQKRRKIATNNASFQLAVEIHNEGEARAVLYSILCGEVPSDDCFDEIDITGQGDFDGIVKCMVTDTRTGEAAAIRERSEALTNQQDASSKSTMEILETKHASACSVLTNLASEYKIASEEEDKLATAHTDAVKLHEKALSTLQKFKVQAQNFFQQDGTPSPRVNQGSQQKLLTAMYKYQGAFETTKEKEAALRVALEDARATLLAKKTQLKRADATAKALEASLRKARQSSSHGKSTSIDDLDEEKISGNRIENIINAILQTAEKRRSQVNRKKNISGHCPVWEEALSGVVSDDTKVSFAQKMQRRRINTILRPSHTSIIREVKKTISESRDHTNVQRHYFDNDTDDEFLDPTLRAEQLLLLSLHPESPMPPLPTIPASSSANQPWAEPGWHVSVDFLPQVRNEFSILPQDAEGHLARAANSICCSTGRQVASFIKPRHLRMLTSDAPMSFVSQASAPAETHPSADDRKVSQDPFSSSEEQMRLGYSFVIRPCTDRPQHLFQEAVLNRPTERKRKPKAEKMDSSSSSSAPPTKRRASKKKIKASDEPAQQTQLATHQQVSNLVSQANQAANAAMFNRMQHFQQLDPQQRLFLMNQQQQQQMMTMNPNMNVMQQQTPSNQPAQLQQQQQFEHLIQMRKQMAMMKQNQQMQFVPTQNQPQGMNFNAQQQFVNQQMHPMQNNTGNNNIQQNTSGPIQHQQN